MNGKQGAALAAGGVGVLFAWSGINNSSALSSVRDLIQGNKPLSGQSQAFSFGIGSSTPAGQATADGNAVAEVGSSAAQNQDIARLLAAPHGWSSGQQFSDLVTLWNGESGWSVTATNPSSGAYGIPQALPGSKMASAGADWKTSASTQIRWGLGYIKDRYGSPSAALAFKRANGWY